MQVSQFISGDLKRWEPRPPGDPGGSAGLVLVFGSSALMRALDAAWLRGLYPGAVLIGCSTAGEIAGSEVRDGTVVVTAIAFKQTRVRGASVSVSGAGRDSLEVGRSIGEALAAPDLCHVFLLSDGLQVNGSELVAGVMEGLPQGVTVTGGLSGDGADFKSTLVMHDGPAQQGIVAAAGLYGRDLKIAYGSLGGWDPFGPDRLITRSEGNVLYELDGKSALELYKRYLGDYAADLPASGLLFPLLVRASTDDPGVVRTILAIDEEMQSMTFAGDVAQGSYARLMRANFDRLIDGATGAARINYESMGARSADLAVLISCVGRKLVLKQRTDEEVEAVREVLGGKPVFAGFYSYGEISPLMPGVKCDLHNQTMTITTFSEP